MTFLKPSLFTVQARRSHSFLSALCGALLFVTFHAAPAHAGGLSIAAEAGPDLALSDMQQDDTQRWGFGASGRIGYRFGIPLVSFTPEIKLGYHSAGEPKAFSGTGGLRVNLLEGISPVIFAHAGGITGDLRGFTWDAGLGLDLTMLPLIDLGIFAAYHRVESAGYSPSFDSESAAWQWLQLGAQVALNF